MRCSISGKLFATKTKVIQHVLTALDIETKGQQILLAQIIDYLRSLIKNKHETYRSLVETPYSNFFLMDIEKY